MSGTVLGAGDIMVSKKRSKTKESCDKKDRIMGRKLKFKIPLNRIFRVSRYI